VQYYWAYFVGYYFSPYAGFAIDDEEGVSFAVGDTLTLQEAPSEPWSPKPTSQLICVLTPKS